MKSGFFIPRYPLFFVIFCVKLRYNNDASFRAEVEWDGIQKQTPSDKSNGALLLHSIIAKRKNLSTPLDVNYLTGSSKNDIIGEK